jgi:hypothetical protein
MNVLMRLFDRSSQLDLCSLNLSVASSWETIPPG